MPCRIRLGNDEREPVGRERDGLLDEPLPVQPLRVEGCGRREEIAGAPVRICVSSVFDPAKLYFGAGVERAEHVGERGRGVDRQ
jgi:hypothetical protein